MRRHPESCSLTLPLGLLLAVGCGSSDADPTGTEAPGTGTEIPASGSFGGPPSEAEVTPALPGSPPPSSTAPQPSEPPAPASEDAAPMGTGPCSLNSGFPGDELCILPPDPPEGFQLHVGPKSYTDAAEIDRFVLLPGQESTQCYFIKTPNQEEVFYYQQRFRMRPGSHHMILNLHGEARPDGWGSCGGGITGAIGGSQRSVWDVPQGGVVPPEDEGLAQRFEPNTQLRIELHFVNATDQPILREAWLNFYYKDPATVTQMAHPIGLIGGLGMRIPPGSQRELSYSCSTRSERRVLMLFGHAHAHNVRFSIYKRSGGSRDLVYESYDWEEPATLEYNSLTENPPPDAALGTAGGHSGMLTFGPNDAMDWECEIHNTSDVTLTFGNEVYTGEMCNTFGTTTGVSAWGCFQL